jgi:hypothetical protein
MRTVGHVEGEISSLEPDERTARSARTPVVSGSSTERRGDSRSFVGLLAGTEGPKRRTRSLQPQLVSDAPRHPVAAALSWLAVCIIETLPPMAKPSTQTSSIHARSTITKSRHVIRNFARRLKVSMGMRRHGGPQVIREPRPRVGSKGSSPQLPEPDRAYVSSGR